MMKWCLSVECVDYWLNPGENNGRENLLDGCCKLNVGWFSLDDRMRIKEI